MSPASHLSTASEASVVRFTRECSPPSTIRVSAFGLLTAAAARSWAMSRNRLWVSREPFKVNIGTRIPRAWLRTVAFLPRHGADHRYPAHRVPYRANLWALRSLGVRQVLAPCAVGGLRPELGPGSFVVPDQLVDRTSGRMQTYYDTGAVHVSFADPYCERLRGHLLDGLADQQPTDGGAMVVIEGPRFSTRAESRWYADQGWAVVNMTGHPEAVLARELALCYATVALVTDHDAGVDDGAGGHGEAVSMEAVISRSPFILKTTVITPPSAILTFGYCTASGPRTEPAASNSSAVSIEAWVSRRKSTCKILGI